ncbi:MAG TPA: pitrilysin family protein, partial [Chloroflexota bacterium]|nr:pitrilysin family protein [Chloroflexota bacterium]
RADPNAYIDELFQRAIFAGHPASIPVLGTPETISGLSPDSIAGTRARFWAASNLALTIAGRIRPDEALALAAEYFGNLFSGSANVRAPATPTGSPFGDAVRATAGRQQAVFRVGYLAPSLLDDDRYPMAVLNAVTSGSSGRLFREIRSARGLAYVAGSGYSPLSDTGAWFATAGVDPDNLDAALSVTRDLIEQLREQAPSSGETSDRQGEIAGRQILADETNEARVGRLASQELLGTVATDEYVRRVRAVTPDDVLRVATTYLDPSSALVVIVQPESTSPTGPP